MAKNKKYNEALEMFTQNGLNAEQIAQNIGVSKRTIYYWMGKENWHKKKQEFENSKRTFTKGLEELCRSLMQKMIQSEKYSHAELYSLVNMLKHLPLLQKYETNLEEEKQDKPKGLTPESIAEIEQLLGIVPKNV